MAEIKRLPREVAELIAAGEVVERPASVVKELLENSVDAHSTAVTVEISRGGVAFIRVSDNGCGIPKNQVKTAFLRHATSKISTEDDLSAITTLGFRGEALAAICSVSRVTMLTNSGEGGASFEISGGEDGELSEAGCPRGTTVIVRDLFYNTPARLKFLKSDQTESAAVAQIVERIALSHPEIAIKLIRDGKPVFSTAGDGKLRSAVYSVLGREFFSSLLPTSLSQNGVEVTGYVSKPTRCRPTRSGQYFFLCGRFVKSGTACAALEQAYKNSVMTGRFPCCVLNIVLPPEAVDVNVHPAKTEVRFSDERRVFSAVYAAVKAALSSGDTRPTFELKNPVPPAFRTAAAPEKPRAFDPPPKAEPVKIKLPDIADIPADGELVLSDFKKPLFAVKDPGSAKMIDGDISPTAPEIIKEEKPQEPEKPQKEPEKAPASSENNAPETDPPESEKEPEELIYIGEIFRTYILVCRGESLFLIDKHASHERIRYEALKSGEIASQALIDPVSVVLSREEYAFVTDNPDIFARFGFETEDFGENTVRVCAVPSMLCGGDIAAAVREIAGRAVETGSPESDTLDDIYHIVACHGAVKAGDLSGKEELLSLARRVLKDDILYCPHGRPVAFELKRRDIEKQFGRLG